MIKTKFSEIGVGDILYYINSNRHIDYVRVTNVREEPIVCESGNVMMKMITIRNKEILETLIIPKDLADGNQTTQRGHQFFINYSDVK